MSTQTQQIVDAVIELACRQGAAPEIVILCKAVLHLYKQTGHLHESALDAFEQIQELDRRQGPGDE